MALEAYGLCRPNKSAITMGTTPLETYYTGADIKFHFPYEVVGWLPLLPSHWIHVMAGVLALAGVTMALGFFYRTSATLVFLSWAYFFLVESTRTYWQNSHYLELLVTLLLAWMPAARRLSVDAWLARGRNPPRTVPFWTVFLIRGQLVIAYFYAGVAKLNTDWLLDAVPMRWYLARPNVIAPFEAWLPSGLAESLKRMVTSADFAYFISYSGAAFDLAIGVLLLLRRTRWFGMILMVVFHVTNHIFIFDDIGWFPLLGVTTALIFFGADWPERWWAWIRHPRLTQPDWGWFTFGAILFPVVGASLGWKSRPGEAVAGDQSARRGHLVALFVMTWLVWQALMPLRHYFIPGDARFNYEGLSFSWRLKVEARHALGVHIFVEDKQILSQDPTGIVRINWAAWHGDRVLYRKLTPGRIDWRTLPEVVVLLEPIVGERIIYNAFAGPNSSATTRDQVQRAEQVWEEFYGQQPESVQPTVPLSQVLDSLAATLRGANRPRQANRLDTLASMAKQIERNELDPRAATKIRREIRSELGAVIEDDSMKRQTAPIVNRMDPFSLEGEGHRMPPLLVVEDPRLSGALTGLPRHIDRTAWKNGPSTQSTRDPASGRFAGDVLVIYTGEIGLDARTMLPDAALFESQDRPDVPAFIRWNSLKDLTLSKYIHISNNAFYLRRYARRIAEIWEKEYGRRPVVKAETAVSLNGRPHQRLVDPEADLASVPVTSLGHNKWILDLETPRIPSDAAVNASGTVGQ